MPVIALSCLSFSICKGPHWRGVLLTWGRSFSLTLHTISEAMASNSRMKIICIECCNQEFCINSFHFGISLVFNSFLTFIFIFNVLTLKFIFPCVLAVMFLFHLCLGIPLLLLPRGTVNKGLTFGHLGGYLACSPTQEQLCWIQKSRLQVLFFKGRR